MPTPSSNTNIFTVYLPFASENILLAFCQKIPSRNARHGGARQEGRQKAALTLCGFNTRHSCARQGGRARCLNLLSTRCGVVWQGGEAACVAQPFCNARHGHGEPANEKGKSPLPLLFRQGVCTGKRRRERIAANAQDAADVAVRKMATHRGRHAFFKTRAKTCDRFVSKAAISEKP